jgi:hypothetical protein
MIAYSVANEHFQAVWNIQHAYATIILCYEQLEPYKQGQIDALHIQPAVNLPGASLAHIGERDSGNSGELLNLASLATELVFFI